MKMTKKQRMVNRFWAWLLTLVMILGLVPIEGLTARAEGFIVVGPGGDDRETKFELVETLDDLQDGDTCVLMGRDLATSSWYVLTSSGDVMQATYEDGEISIITPEGMDILPDLARMTVESMTVINGSAQIEGGFDYATLYLELGEGTGCFLGESEMSVTWRSSEYELTAGVDANGVYLGNIYMSYTEGDPSSLEAYNEPWVVTRDVWYEGTADEYVEYRIGLPWSETVDDWSNPTAYLYKIPSETQQVNPPAAPANFQTEADNELGARLSWEASEGATAYVVYRNDVVLATTEELEYQDSDLTAGNAYSYAVSAKNRGGESDKTAAISVTATLAVPPMPTNLTVTPGLRGTLDMSLSWSAPEPLRKTTGYHVYRDGVRITESPITETTYVDQAEYAGQNLTYAVTAVNASGESEKTSEVGAKAPSVLPPSCDVTVSINLPNAGLAKAFLSKSGSVQLRGERSYSLPITQDGDVGTYEFSDVLEDTYELVLLIGGKVVYSQQNAMIVKSGNANAVSADLSGVTDGFHGMIRIKQPGIVSSYHLRNNGYGWTVNEEGYLTDPNGNSAFWWNGERVFVKGTEYVYKAEEDKCYQLLDQVGVDLSKVTTGLTYQLPVGAQEDLVVVHVALTAAGVDLNQFYVMTTTWQNGSFLAHGSLYLDHEGRAELLLPKGTGYEVSLRVLRTVKDGVTIPERAIKMRPVANGDTISQDLLEDDLFTTVTVDFSETLTNLPDGISLEGMAYTITDTTNSYGRTLGYLDAQGKGSVKMRKGDWKPRYVVSFMSQQLSKSCRLLEKSFASNTATVTGKLEFEMIKAVTLRPVFQINSGADMNGIVVHFTVDGVSFDETLVDGNRDGISDNAFAFDGYELDWKVDEQELIDGIWLKGMHSKSASGYQQLEAYRKLEVTLPGNGWNCQVYVYDVTNGKKSMEFFGITSESKITATYHPVKSGETQELTVMVIPYLISYDWNLSAFSLSEWEEICPKLVKHLVAPASTIDFSDAVVTGDQLIVRDLDGNKVNEYVKAVYVYQGKAFSTDTFLTEQNAMGHVNYCGDGVKCMFVPAVIPGNLHSAGYLDNLERYISDPAYKADCVPNGKMQTVYLPYQMIYRLNIVGADGKALPDQDLEGLCVRVFDSRKFLVDGIDVDPAGTRLVLLDPISTNGEQYSLFIGYGKGKDADTRDYYGFHTSYTIDDTLSGMYAYWDDEDNAYRRELNIRQQSGILNVQLNDFIQRKNRNVGMTTYLKGIVQLGDGKLLVRLTQTSDRTGWSYVRIPEGAYDVTINQKSPIMQDGMISVKPGMELLDEDWDRFSKDVMIAQRNELCFTISEADLENDRAVITYICTEGKYSEQRYFLIPYAIFDYSLGHEISSNEIVFDEPVASSLKKGETAHVPSIYGLQPVGGRYWDPDPIIDGTKIYDTHFNSMEEYRDFLSYQREGAWLSFNTRQEDFEIALNVDGVPVEYSDSILPLMPASSLGMFVSGYVSGGTDSSSETIMATGHQIFTKKPDEQRLSKMSITWEDASGSGETPHVWVNKAWLEEYGFYSEDEGLGFLFIPMSEPESYPHAYDIDLRFRYVDGTGQTQTIKCQDYVTVFEDAPILEKWSFDLEVDKDTTCHSIVYHTNIRSREDRQDYDENKDKGYEINWNGTLTFTFRARFDDPDGVENVYAVAEVPDDCENFAIKLERITEDADGYNYMGTGLLGDYLNPPKNFAIAYSLKTTKYYNNMPVIDLADGSETEEDFLLELPKGWTYEEAAPENGWTLKQTDDAWNLYAKDVADGTLDDYAPYADNQQRLYWPAIKVFDETGELVAVYENFIDFADTEDSNSGYHLAITDRGEYRATLNVTTDYDPDNLYLTRRYACTDAGYLMPIPKDGAAPVSPAPAASHNSLVPMKAPVPNISSVIKTAAGKGATVAQTAKYYGDRATKDIKPVLQAGKNADFFNNLYDDMINDALGEAWLNNLPDDVRAEYQKYYDETMVQKGVEAVAGSIPGIGLVGKAILGIGEYFLGNKRAEIDATYRKIAHMKAMEDLRSARLAKYLADNRDSEELLDYLTSIYGREMAYRLLGRTPCYHIDPSGYVYEGIESNVIQGVTATIYQYTGSTAGWTFDENGMLTSGTPEADKWVVWDSESYGEDPNPHDTDAYGHYGWDVLIGAWKVVFEKDGYVSAESAVLNVPPAHTDVNLSMVAIHGAKVELLTANEEYVEITFDKPVLVDDVTSLVTICADNDKNVLSGSFAAVDAAPLGTGNKQAVGAEDITKLISSVGADAKAATTFRYVASGLSLGQTILLLQTIGVRSYNGIVAQIDYASTTVQKKTDPITNVEYVGSVAEMAAQETRNLAEGLVITGTEGSLTWTSMVPSVATVSGSGVLTAKETEAGGNAIVKVAVAGTDLSWIISIPVAAKVKPIAAASPVDNLPKNHAHVWGDWTVIKDATETEEGSKSHFCTLCGEEEAEVIPVGSTVTQTQEEFYYLDPTSGCTSYVSGAAGGMKVVVKHTTKDSVLFVTFVGIEVDGIPVDKANYVAEAGSVKITLLKKYLDTLSVGEHTMRVLFSDSSHLEFKFTILPAPEKGSIASPASGDNGAGAFSWAVLALVSCAVVTGSLGYRRRRKEKKVA